MSYSAVDAVVEAGVSAVATAVLAGGAVMSFEKGSSGYHRISQKDRATPVACVDQATPALGLRQDITVGSGDACPRAQVITVGSGDACGVR